MHENKQKKNNLNEDNYLDLWKYFQERADSLKGSMFQSITWIIGFASALLGFILSKFIDYTKMTLEVKHANLAVFFSAIGIVLCVYALFLLSEFASHIRGNWQRSDECIKHIKGLDIIIDASKGGFKFGEIWHKIGAVVMFFLFLFVVLIIGFTITKFYKS